MTDAATACATALYVAFYDQCTTARLCQYIRSTPGTATFIGYHWTATRTMFEICTQLLQSHYTSIYNGCKFKLIKTVFGSCQSSNVMYVEGSQICLYMFLTYSLPKIYTNKLCTCKCMCREQLQIYIAAYPCWVSLGN